MRAFFVRDYPQNPAIHWRLYRCQPGGRLPEFVIVSATAAVSGAMQDFVDRYPRHRHQLNPADYDETRIFPSNSAGEVSDFNHWLWEERGTLDHEHVLRQAGYEPEGYPEEQIDKQEADKQIARLLPGKVKL